MIPTAVETPNANKKWIEGHHSCDIAWYKFGDRMRKKPAKAKTDQATTDSQHDRFQQKLE